MVYNVKIIEYDDYIHIQHFDRSLSRVDFPEEEQKVIDEFEKEVIKNDFEFPQNIDEADVERKRQHSLLCSVNRSKNNMFRIARSNNWDIFATFTFDRNGLYTEAVDSSDYNLISKLMTSYLKGLRKECPEMKYLVVPELHKDGIHYHFHALLSNISAEQLELVKSNKLDSMGSEIFNIKSWEHGFSTAVYIVDQARVKNYIGKYICKDLMNKLKYKKRYYASQNVNICPEQYYGLSLEDIYDLYGERISFVKTITVNGVNRIHYFEIKK